jgi:hypothetical protein
MTTFPLNPVRIVLSVQTNVRTGAKEVILFTPLKKEECDLLTVDVRRYIQFPKTNSAKTELDAAFLRVHKFSLSNILSIGDTKLETRLANIYIENTSSKYSDILKRNYKCFVNADWKNPINKVNLPYHEDGGCSWNCLMDKLRRPEFGVIYTMSLDIFKTLENAKID